MAWAKFDDRWATHPKLLAAGLEAKGLDASGICYCAGQETDGFVPDSALVILAAGHRHPKKVADRLIEVGRWSRDDERKGYVIHDFEVYNFTRAQGEAKRTRDAERKAAARAKQGRDAQGRLTSGQTDEDVRADTDDCPLGFHDESEWTPTLVPPVPTRPDPTPTDVDRSSSSNTVAAPPSEEEEIRKTARAAADEVARRRLVIRAGPPITDPTAWLAATAARVYAQHGAAFRAGACNGDSIEVMADRIMPSAKGPAAYAEQRPGEFVEVVDDEGRLIEAKWVAS